MYLRFSAQKNYARVGESFFSFREYSGRRISITAAYRRETRQQQQHPVVQQQQQHHFSLFSFPSFSAACPESRNYWIFMKINSATIVPSHISPPSINVDSNVIYLKFIIFTNYFSELLWKIEDNCIKNESNFIELYTVRLLLNCSIKSFFSPMRSEQAFSR